MVPVAGGCAGDGGARAVLPPVFAFQRASTPLPAFIVDSIGIVPRQVVLSRSSAPIAARGRCTLPKEIYLLGVYDVAGDCF